MVDQLTIQRIQLLHPSIRQEVEDIYRNEIVPALASRTFCRFSQTFRTFAEQEAIYAQGRTKLYDANGTRLGIVSKSKPGQSMHNFGLAVDIVLIDGNSASWNTIKDYDGDGKGDWGEVAKIFKSHGYTWGGDWKNFPDMPHFEKTFGHTWHTLLPKYQAKEFISGTKYVAL